MSRARFPRYRGWVRGEGLHASERPAKPHSAKHATKRISCSRFEQRRGALFGFLHGPSASPNLGTSTAPQARELGRKHSGYGERARTHEAPVSSSQGLHSRAGLARLVRDLRGGSGGESPPRAGSRSCSSRRRRTGAWRWRREPVRGGAVQPEALVGASGEGATGRCSHATT